MGFSHAFPLLATLMAGRRHARLKVVIASAVF